MAVCFALDANAALYPEQCPSDGSPTRPQRVLGLALQAARQKVISCSSTVYVHVMVHMLHYGHMAAYHPMVQHVSI